MGLDRGPRGPDGGRGMNIPEEAIEAACNAFQRPNRMLINTSDGNLKGRLEAAFEEAEPHLRKKWAE